MSHIHFIGIGGSGLSAIARVMLERGTTVSGSDRTFSALAGELESAGVKVYNGHAAANIAGADLVVRSSAILDDNPEVQAARLAGIPVLKRIEFLPQLIGQAVCVAVAGTHGKTTTTAMTAWVFTRLGFDPSYIIGGVSKNLGRNARAGQGKYFVIEADEYDHMFLGLSPRYAIVTIVEHDHPDCFPSPEIYQAEFEKFAGRLQPGGVLICCADDPGAARLSGAIPAGCSAVTYGISPSAEYQAVLIGANPNGGLSFTLRHAPTGQSLARVDLAVPGEHNVRNAAATLALAHQAGLPLDKAADALAEFSGSGRRFDLRGEAYGVAIIDDYAHHPTEIRTTLAAARQRYPERRIWAVWQPHTFLRTRTLLDSFAASFQDADRVIVTKIYAARDNDDSFSADMVVKKMSQTDAEYIAELDTITAALLRQVQPGDVVLVLSAGDADQISVQLLAALQQKETHHG